MITLSRWICQISGNSQRPFARGLVYAVAIASLSLTHLFIFTDQFIYKMYSFHMNGFVWNIILTKGGIESLAAGTSTVVIYFVIIAVILLLELTALFVIMRFDVRFFLKSRFGRNWDWLSSCCVFLCKR